MKQIYYISAFVCITIMIYLIPNSRDSLLSDKVVHSIALFKLGKTLYYQGNKDEGYRHMQHATTIMKGTNYKYKQNNLYYNHHTLQLLRDLDKYNDEKLPTLYDRFEVQKQRCAILEFITIYQAYEWGVEQRKQDKRLLFALFAFLFLMTLFTSNLPNIRDKNIAQYENIVIETTIDTNIDEDTRLFDKLEYIVTHEKLFLDPTLSRERLMKLIHVNKNHFGKILQKYAGTNIATYINNKRLEYATQLLNESPQYTIAAIGELCGIPNPSTFNRLFRCKFGISPSEYKKKTNSTDYKQHTSNNGQSDTCF